MTLPFHPLAQIFPLIEGGDFEDLVEDIRVNGIRDPIVVLDGAVLDGRNRYRALLELQRTGEIRGPGWGGYAEQAVTDEDLAIDAGFPWFERYSAMLLGAPLAFVISKNLKRRHLNESQRAMVAARLANLGQGRPSADPEKPANLPVKQPDAAKQLSVSERLVRSARVVQEHATPELQRAVDQGRLAVSAAAQAAALPIETQRKIAEEAEAGRANAARTVIKQERRDARERELGEAQLAAPEGKFGVIVEDYEWDHETWSERGRDRAAENHYPVSKDAHSAQEVVERTKDRFACAADNCVLFMWTTNQHLAVAIDVLRMRGFEYKSNYAWGKDKIGLGFWNREKHELLLIGVKGKIDCPAPGTQWESLIVAPRGEHSAKPQCFMEMIEQYFPTLPKLELNSRVSRPGWTVWGLDARAAPLSVDPFDPSAPCEAKIDPNQKPWNGPTLADCQATDNLDIPGFLRRPLPENA